MADTAAARARIPPPRAFYLIGAVVAAGLGFQTAPPGVETARDSQAERDAAGAGERAGRVGCR